MSAELPEKLLGITIEDPDEEEPTEREAPEPEELERFVYVSVDGLDCALPVEDVKAILEPPTLTRVPRSPAAIIGITDLRGEITAVVDPRPLLSLAGDSTDEPSETQRLVVLDRPIDRQPAAILVDEVTGVEAIPERNVRDPADVDVDDGPHPALIAARVDRWVGEDDQEPIYDPVLDVETILSVAGAFE